MMLKRVVLLVVGSLVIVGATAFDGTTTSAFATPTQVLSAPKRACAGFCHVCTQGGHSAVAALPEDIGPRTANEGDDWHSACQGSDNCTGHICVESFAATSSITDALRDGDVATLARLLKNNQGLVALSVERHALQVKGCDGRIAANYPLTQALENQLTRLTQ